MLLILICHLVPPSSWPTSHNKGSPAWSAKFQSLYSLQLHHCHWCLIPSSWGLGSLRSTTTTVEGCQSDGPHCLFAISSLLKMHTLWILPWISNDPLGWMYTKPTGIDKMRWCWTRCYVPLTMISPASASWIVHLAILLNHLLKRATNLMTDKTTASPHPLSCSCPCLCPQCPISSQWTSRHFSALLASIVVLPYSDQAHAIPTRTHVPPCNHALTT